MGVAAMKINRLLEITLLLINRGTVTARELAERFGVSRRTIYRDVDDLSSAGVPVFASQGRNGGVSLLENYSFNRAFITEHERDGLLLALKTLQTTRYPEIEGVIGKIGALFKHVSTDDWVHVEFSPWGSGPDDSNKFTDVRKAILESKVIVFDYISAEGVRSQCSIEPMRLVYRGQAWYLWGYCRTRQAFRTFRISRIRNLVVTGEAFQRRTVASVKKEEAGVNLEKRVTIKLKFQPEALYRLYDDYDDEKITKNPDGTCQTTVTFIEDEWVYGYILSFGSYVEVLEPPHVRDIIRQKMKKALAYYQ
jgi:predicted DNA-binding transcriptional regulator YafY